MSSLALPAQSNTRRAYKHASKHEISRVIRCARDRENAILLRTRGSTQDEISCVLTCSSRLLSRGAHAPPPSEALPQPLRTAAQQRVDGRRGSCGRNEASGLGNMNVAGEIDRVGLCVRCLPLCGFACGSAPCRCADRGEI